MGEIAASGAPAFAEMGLLVIPADAGFDPAKDVVA